MGFLGGIGKAFHSIVNVVDKGLSILKAPLDFVMKPVEKVLDKVADKLPFGLGNVVKPFISTFLNSAVGFLSGGPLGGLFSMMSNVADKASKIDDILHTIDGALNGGISGLPDLAKDNLTEGTAWSQAQNLFQ
jgi:hypothetical protein